MSELNLSYKHTFVICAYKESPYLEKCIQSLLAQTISSKILLITSTPCNYIENLCQKYNIPYYINTGETGITQDWNFAYSKCTTPFITIAHQDDIYFKHYTETVLKEMKRAKKPLIFFCNYYEIRNGKLVKRNRLLKVKRILLFLLRFSMFQKSIVVRRRILSLGCPICCPSVTFARENLPKVIFKNHFRSNEDWEAWEMISKLKGEFIYVPKAFMAHRIHKDSETTAIIQANGRNKEDIEMFEKFWPTLIAKIISYHYKKSESSNNN